MTTIERRPNIVGLVSAVVAMVAVGLVWMVARSSGEGAAIGSTAPVSTSSTTSTSRAAVVTSTSSTTCVVPDLALPSTAGVVVFAHTSDPDVLLRIDIDGGAVTTTPIGNAIMSSAPVFLLAGPSAVVLRPFDNVPGVFVADNAAATGPPGLLGLATSMACSDGRSDRVWLERDTLVQVDYRGLLTAQIGGARRSELGCDGAGEMLYREGSTIFVTSYGTPTAVTDGMLIAAGPTTFLVRDCAAAASCTLTAIDRPTGQRRALTIDAFGTTPQSFPVQPEGRIGSISPDGRTALVFRGANEAVFVEMNTGVGQGITSIASAFQSFVWSADSRYAFYIRADHTLAAFDRQTRNIKALGVNNVVALGSRPT